MGYEIDYIAVGDGSRSGDAIALRYGNLHGPREQQTVVTIDGGTLESGEKLVRHIKEYYQTDKVDIAILTHADSDHASGMREILEHLKVSQVAMHLPWSHSADVKALLDDKSITINAIRQKVIRNLSAARDIEKLALAKGIPIVEPFAGVTNKNHGLIVLGPTEDFYQDMLSGFKCVPGALSSTVTTSFLESLRRAAEKVINWIQENWFTETLQEPASDAISAENNSSVILLLNVDGQKSLFTGDAGVPAFTAALDYAQHQGISLEALRFFDVPHHGSRKNLGPTILNRLFGNIRQQQTKDWTAFISAAKEGAPKHPHKKITNALQRRGANVHATAGIGKWHHNDSPARTHWSDAIPVPFYSQVEDDDS
jgi:beta-lactamase superfamily II metal-dependent hydrolase